MSKNPDFSKTSSRMWKIKCCGDSNNVANILEDIAEKIRNGAIHGKCGMFYEFDSLGYVKDEVRERSDTCKRELEKMIN